jgi:hypothetical protein
MIGIIGFFVCNVDIQPLWNLPTNVLTSYIDLPLI